MCFIKDKGLSERRALRAARMSGSAYRYKPAADKSCELRQKIVALAQRHRRYGAGMIYLKLRQAGEKVNHKRVERLCAQAGVQLRKRKRKKVPQADRCPLGRPCAANQVWSMDFVFDRTAEGRSIKSLTVIDDATHEAVAIVSERALSGRHLVRILDQLTCTRGLPQAIRTDNGREFCGRAMLSWAHERGIKLFLIEPGKPNQNAISNHSTEGSGMNVSTSTGLPACSMPRLLSRAGDGNTTRKGPRSRWAVCRRRSTQRI